MSASSNLRRQLANAVAPPKLYCLQKYEKARKLKDIIGVVRQNYEADLSSTEGRKRQMACALYFIDKLALRAGHEKDDDEADTVGCCTLKVCPAGNVQLAPPSRISAQLGMYGPWNTHLTPKSHLSPS